MEKKYISRYFNIQHSIIIHERIPPDKKWQRNKKKNKNKRKKETLSEYWFIESFVDTDKYHLIFNAFEVKLIFKTTGWLFLLSCSLLRGLNSTGCWEEKKEIERDSIMIKKHKGRKLGCYWIVINGKMNWFNFLLMEYEKKSSELSKHRGARCREVFSVINYYYPYWIDTIY